MLQNLNFYQSTNARFTSQNETKAQTLDLQSKTKPKQKRLIYASIIPACNHNSVRAFTSFIAVASSTSYS